MSLFATAVIAVIGLGVLLAVIVSLAVPVAERRERRKAAHRPTGRHSHEFVHGGRS